MLDPEWANDPGVTKFKEFMKKYYPDGNVVDSSNIYGYTVARTIEQVLKQCGDNLTRENVMKQAAAVKGLKLDTLIPGIDITTGPQDYAPIQAVQLQRFNGQRYERFGKVLSSAK